MGSRTPANNLRSVYMSLVSRIGGYLNLLSSGDFDDFVWRAQIKIRSLDLRMLATKDSSSCHDYSDSGAGVRRALKELAIPKTGVAIDVGCGKAGAVIQLARWFDQADGLDIDEQLLVVGRENLSRMGVNNARLIAGNAATFGGIDEYQFFYFFNPFPRPVMAQVVANIAASVTRRPRPVMLLYFNPIDGDLFEQAGFHQIGRMAPRRGQEDWRTARLYSGSCEAN
jgi:Methyltransferase domain